MKQPRELWFHKHPESGIVRVRIYTQRGSCWLSTGQTSYQRAREVCDRAMVEKLQMAACAEALTADVISRLTTGRRFTCVDILEAWKQDALMDMKPDTFNAYEMSLSHWMAFCECEKLPLAAVSRRMLTNFVNEAGIAAGTRQRRLSALKSYYKFASAAGYIVGNLAERVKVITYDLLYAQVEPHHAEPFTEEEYRLLVTSPKMPLFWKLVTALSWWVGLRARDCAMLERASIGPDFLIVHTRKTGARVCLNLDDPIIGGGELRGLMAEIIMQTPPGSKFCFPELRQAALDPKKQPWLSYTFKRLLKKHGIRDKTFHGLRHSCAMRWQKQGLSLEKIAQGLGHSNTGTTEIYLSHE